MKHPSSSVLYFIALTFFGQSFESFFGAKLILWGHETQATVVVLNWRAIDFATCLSLLSTFSLRRSHVGQAPYLFLAWN
jgi:hypothetical protein